MIYNAFKNQIEKVPFRRALFYALSPVEAPFALHHLHDVIYLPHYPSLKLPLTTVFPKTDNSHTASVLMTLGITFFSFYLYICQLAPSHSLSACIDMVNSWR